MRPTLSSRSAGFSQVVKQGPGVAPAPGAGFRAQGGSSEKVRPTLSGRSAGSSHVMKKGLGARPGSSNLLMVATRQVSLLPSGRSRTMCPSMWSSLHWW